MIRSMTAFARQECKGEWGNAVWEVRSVNQRFNEFYFRLPEQFRGLEPILRERFRKAIQRGKVECSLRFVANEGATGNISLNQALAKKLLEAGEWVTQQGKTAEISPTDILRWPGVIAAEEADIDAIQSQLLSAFDQTLSEFISARETEGNNLKNMIETRLDAIEVEVTKITNLMPEIIQLQKDKILARFEEAKIELEDTRLEQEMVMLAQKIDIAEELDRLNSHIGETRKILKKGGAVGRKLDFMMQEFNRESNTLGSKSVHKTSSQVAVELKVLIEQMREQIQNIE